MKVLYLSAMHGVMEYDNCITFEELGFDWFSTGIYNNPNHPIDYPGLNIRKPINKVVDTQAFDEFFLNNPNYYSQFVGLNRPEIKVSRKLVDMFDVVFCTYFKHIINNWENLKHKPIIWRTSGSINEPMEREMKPYVDNGNIYPVRFSEQELLSPISNGGTVIRNFVDENLYNSWGGNVLEILTFQSWFTQRRTLKINDFYLKHIYNKSNYSCRLYGAYVGAKDPISLGSVSWDKQRDLYRNCRVYFYIGSPVGVVAYNYMEAMMTGCPVVTFGPGVGGYHLQSINKVLHEPSEFIDNGVNGFYSDNPLELKSIINSLMTNNSLSKKVSQEARKSALKRFSKSKGIQAWKDFFNSL